MTGLEQIVEETDRRLEDVRERLVNLEAARLELRLLEHALEQVKRLAEAAMKEESGTRMPWPLHPYDTLLEKKDNPLIVLEYPGQKGQKGENYA